MFDAQDLPASAATQMDAPSLPVPGGGQPVHVLDRLAALLKHRRIAGAAFVVVVGAMMLQAYSQVPMYRTSARVVIQDERSIAVGNLNANDPMFWQETDPYYNTQYSILRSRGLAKRVVRRLELQNHPLFNGSAPRRQGIATMVADARRKVTGAVRSLIQRQPPGPPVEPPSPDEDAAEAGRISQFLGGVRIVPEAKTKLVEIIYQQGIAAPSWESSDLTELFLVGLISILIRSYTSKHCRYC